MDSTLWTEKYQPEIGDFPQEDLNDKLDSISSSRVNVFLYGPPGVGKTAAAHAIARRLHDDPENDVITINISDFFNRSKKEIRNDKRFSQFLKGEVEWTKQTGQKKYKSSWSKREMITHILGEIAAIPPTNGNYKTIILDNAEETREDFQQALRRIMEKHHETTHFIFTSRSVGGMINAILSRCISVPITTPSTEATAQVLENILQQESIDYEKPALLKIAARNNGNIRRSILELQSVVLQYDELTIDTVEDIKEETSHTSQAREIIRLAQNGEMKEARKEVDDLLDNHGYTGQEVLRLLVDELHTESLGEELRGNIIKASDVDLGLTDSQYERVNVMEFVSQL